MRGKVDIPHEMKIIFLNFLIRNIVNSSKTFYLWYLYNTETTLLYKLEY